MGEVALNFVDMAIGVSYLIVISLAGAASIVWWTREDA
jgi:hypothetical protein